MAQLGVMLSVEDLAIAIDGHRIVDGVSLSVASGRILAIVGESGCGKSLTALSMLGLLPKAAQVAGGTIRLGERTLTALSEAEMAQVRGNDAAIIFQEPLASLNPLMRVGAQVEEALLLHRGLSRSAAREEAIATMARVGIPDPARRAQQYPFELSGGMCQRIMIASALICRPSLLIADEPTTALDVTIQAQILELIRTLRDEVGSAVVLITHDMGVVADLADEVCVMYGGRIVESGPSTRSSRRRATPTPGCCWRRSPSSTAHARQPCAPSRASCPRPAPGREAAVSARAARWPTKPAPRYRHPCRSGRSTRPPAGMSTAWRPWRER